MSLKAARRLFDIGDGSMYRAEMLVLDLDDFTSRKNRGECFFAYSNQLSQEKRRPIGSHVRVVFSNQVMTPAFSSSDLVEAESTL
jgi:hypothetical protein